MIQVISWLIVAGLGLSVVAAMNALYVDSLRKRIEELEGR